VAAWPAIALVGSYELLMMIIRSSQVPAGGAPETGHDVDPLREQAVELFAGQLAADRVPSVRAIRAQLHVGQPRAQRLQDYLATSGASQPGRPKESARTALLPQRPRYQDLAVPQSDRGLAVFSLTHIVADK
jgi:hypothetical protein